METLDENGDLIAWIDDDWQDWCSTCKSCNALGTNNYQSRSRRYCRRALG